MTWPNYAAFLRFFGFSRMPLVCYLAGDAAIGLAIFHWAFDKTENGVLQMNETHSQSSFLWRRCANQNPNHDYDVRCLIRSHHQPSTPYIQQGPSIINHEIHVLPSTSPYSSGSPTSSALRTVSTPFFLPSFLPSIPSTFVPR